MCFMTIFLYLSEYNNIYQQCSSRSYFHDFGFYGITFGLITISEHCQKLTKQNH